MEDVVKGVGGEYTGNYTGPYWSDGKIQSSVEFGKSDPQSELDALSRLHDSAYAKFPDAKHREAADKLYNDEAQKLVGKFPHLAGNLVLYGNHILRHPNPFRMVGGGLLGNAGHLASLVYTAAGGIKDANRYYGGQALAREIEDVRNYYKQDPKRSTPITATTNVVNPSKLEGKVSGDDLRKAALVASQARRVQNYVDLKNEAVNSTKSKNSENTNPIEFLGYRPKFMQKAFRKRKKKNKIHLEPIRI